MGDSAPRAASEALLPTPRPLPRRGGYGRFARWLLHTLFDIVPFPAEAVPQLAELSRKATLVYVLRSSSLLQLLYFNWTFWKLGLPIARAATGLGYRIFSPFARWYLGGPQIRAPSGGEAAHVVEAVRRGESAMVFLRAPRTVASSVVSLADPFPALVELQRAAPERPIALVPLTLLWRNRPKKLAGSWRDALFGDPEEPGALRTLVGYFNRKSSFAKVGEIVLLSDVTAMQPGAETDRVARRVRGWLHQHLAREVRVVTGPPLKRPERVIDETLRDLSLQRALAEIAEERGRSPESVEREARKDLKEIAARYQPLVVDILKLFLTFVFNRIYDGVDVDEQGMRRLVEASKKAPLILCPCHKSHIDYMILSMICDDYGLQPPHVAAGDNLDFWPVGRLLRAGGAYFIRRSFKGDRIYAATMGAYVKRLLQDGFTQEFFIEGGRSRTGKLLPPKYGMLTLEVEAWLTGVKPDAYFAPISISYEKMVEASAYQRELQGGEKRKEDAKALLSATKVLRSRYGRITIRVDEPISLAQLFRERGVDPKNCTAEEKKKIVQHLGLDIAAGINAAAPLAPMGLLCAVLLSHDKRALSEQEILERAGFLHTAARDCGAHGSADAAEPLILRAVESLVADGSLRRHEAGGARYYSVPEERRIALDYHKNGILHFLVAPAILAAALRSFRGQAAPHGELLRRAKEASRLTKYEFIFPPGHNFENTVGENFALLLRWGLAEREGDLVRAASGGARMLALLGELLRPFGEGVWLAVDSLRLLLAGPMAAREWTRQALDRGRAAYLAGRILRLEALTKPTLENALAMLRDRGVVVGARLQLTAEWSSEARLAALSDEVDLFLR
ncbi:MAG: glycerol-3-phosphate acyltransferase [Deltaproteobacteria bacterium]|nr:MAG: glycerol-3-phosphate acyltransferase [Deltaproteobacteria bacterium]